MKKVTTIIVLVMAVSFIGCSDPSGSKHEVRDRLRAKAAKKVAEEEANRKANATVSEGAKAKLPAKSIEDLVEAYKLAFDAGDTETLKTMSHLENSTPETEHLFYSLSLGFDRAGHSQIEDEELVDLEEDEVMDHWSLRPEKLFRASLRKESSVHRVKLPIVFIDGAYYFYACARPTGK